MGARLVRIDRPTGPPNPFECYMLAACTVEGVAVLARVAKPSAISSTLPPVMFYLWALLLLVGGTLGLVGLLWPGDGFTGIEVKRVGLVAVAFGTAAYAVALVVIGPAGYVAALSNLAFAVASLVRVRQIHIALERARTDISSFRDDQQSPP